MDSELSQICDKLASGAENWEVRCGALKQLATLAEGFAAAPAEARRGFSQSLRAAHELVAKQLRDLRSQVAAEACRTVAVCARGCGGDVGAAADAWAAALVALLAGTGPKVVASAADAAVRALVEAAAPRGAAAFGAKLLDAALHAKAPPTRRSCLDYAALAVASWDAHPVVEGLLPQVTHLITAKARDADDKVRKAARGLWWATRIAGFAHQAQTIAGDMDATTRKALEREKPRGVHVDALQTLQPPPPAKKLSALAGGRAKEPPPPGVPARAGRQAASGPPAAPKYTKHTAHRREAGVVVDDGDAMDEDDGASAAPDAADDDVSVDEAAAGALALRCAAAFAAASSPHWDVRRDAIASLTAVLAPRAATGAQRAEAWRVAVNAIGDAHHQVALAALEVVSQRLAAAPADALGAKPGGQQFSVLSALLATTAQRLVDVRQPLRAAAAAVFEAARRACAPAALLAAVAPRVAQLAPLRARAALLEFAAVLIRLDGERTDSPYLEPDSPAFRDFALKLASTLLTTLGDAARAQAAGAANRTANDGAPAAFAAAARCATALRRVDAAAFARTVAAFSAEERSAVRDGLAELAPEFEAQLASARAALRGGSAAPAPAPAASDSRTALADAVAALVDQRPDDAALEARQREARLVVAKLARSQKHDDTVWKAYFEQIAMLLLEHACASHDRSGDSCDGPPATINLSELAARHESLGALRALATRRPALFKAVVDTAVPRLLRLARAPRSLPLELCWAAERVLFAVAESVDSVRLLQLVVLELERSLPQPDAQQADVAAADDAQPRAPLARVVGRCARHAPSAVLRTHLAMVLPALASCAAAPRAEARKAAVDAIVELYVALGDAIIPRLKPLMHQDHIDLVAMYVHKRSDAS